MAEIVGLVTGVVGVAPVIAKCIKSIKRLRNIRAQVTTIPEELRTLIEDLDILEPFIRQLEQASAVDTSPYQAKLEALDKSLTDFLSKLPSDFNGKRQKAKVVWEFRHWREDVEVLRRGIQKTKIDLMFCGQ